MSDAALTWAFPIPITGTRKAVLLALAGWADEAGACSPTIAEISLYSGVRDRAAREALSSLEDDGLVQTHRVAGRATRFTLALTPASAAGPRQQMPDTPAADAGVRQQMPGSANGSLPPLPAPLPAPSFPPTPPLTTPPITPPIAPLSPAREPAAIDLFGKPTPTQPPSPPAPPAKAAPAPKAPKVTRPKQTDETPEFLAFWAAYPRKDARGGAKGAVGAWHAATRIAQPAEIMAGLARYAFSDDPHYRPLASTWLNQHRWRVEVDTAPPTALVRPGPARPTSDLLGSLRRVMGGPPARASPRQDDVPDYIDLPPGDYENVN